MPPPPFDRLFSRIGTVAFCFAIHMVVLPMAQSLRPKYLPKRGKKEDNELHDRYNTNTNTADVNAFNANADGGHMVAHVESHGFHSHPSGEGGGALPLLANAAQQHGAEHGAGGTGGVGGVGVPVIDDHGFAKVALWSYVVVVVINMAFGILCWFLFGDDVLPNVLNNIHGNDAIGTNSTGAGGILIDGIKVTMSVAMLFTLPMILAVGREIVEEKVMEVKCSSSCPETSRNLTRLILVGVVVGIVRGVYYTYQWVY